MADDTAVRPRVPADQARTRKRFVRRRWRRRWLTWKPALALALVLVLAGVAVWFVLFSRTLAVQHVHVSGADLLSKKYVVRIADVERDGPLALVDLRGPAQRLRSLAPIKSVDVTREWPDSVRIQVRERTAVAVVELGDRVRGMDAEGIVFRDFDKAPENLPLVRIATGTSAEAMAEAASVVAALPRDLARDVEYLEVLTVDQITLQLRDGRQVVWGSAEQSDVKAEVLAALLGQDAKVYDVSAPGSPTIR